MSAGEHNLEFDAKRLSEELERARRWLRGSRGPIFADMRNSRA